MFRRAIITACALTCAALPVSTVRGIEAAPRSVDVVVEWNRTLLAIVRTPGAQPATIHPTRSFAMMHAAIYDAVNSIVRTHEPYVEFVPRETHVGSPDVAAAAAAHTILVALYPAFTKALDAELQQSLSHGRGRDEAEGIRIGEAAADQILARRSLDGSDARPPTYIFGSAPGEYQSTPPNFPKQPVFTHWSAVQPFVLARADQFRPGPPPALASETYRGAFNEVRSLGVAGSTAARPSISHSVWPG